MGRRARPVELLVLKGRKHLTKAEIQGRRQAEAALRPASAKLKPPEWLDKAARKEWRRVVKLLEGTGLLTDADVNTLAAYCDAAARYAEAAERVAREGLVLTNSKGDPIQNPAVIVAERYLRIMARAATALGLDPTSRAALARAKAQQERARDPFDEMFGVGTG